MRKLVIAIAMIACPAGLFAQEANFAAFVRDANQKAPAPAQAIIAADALKTVQAIAAQDKQCVPSAIVMETPTPITATPLAVAAISAGQAKNLWTAYGRVKGCPVADPIRFVVIQPSSGEIMAREVNIGEAIASPSMMRDTSAIAAIGALHAVKAKKADCAGDGMKMLRTRIISRSKDLSPDFFGARYAGNWTEGWTFSVCDVRVEVAVEFTADGEGGAYTKVPHEKARLLD